MIGALRLPLHRRIVAPTLRFAGFTPPKQISNSSAMNAKFSPGEDGDQLTKETKTLLEETKWRLTDAQTGLEKTFYFKTFTKVLVRALFVFCVAASNGRRTLQMSLGSGANRKIIILG